MEYGQLRDGETYYFRPVEPDQIKWYPSKPDAIARVNQIVPSPREIGGMASVCLLFALLFGAVISLVLIKR